MNCIPEFVFRTVGGFVTHIISLHAEMQRLLFKGILDKFFL